MGNVFFNNGTDINTLIESLKDKGYEYRKVQDFTRWYNHEFTKKVGTMQTRYSNTVPMKEPTHYPDLNIEIVIRPNELGDTYAGRAYDVDCFIQGYKVDAENLKDLEFRAEVLSKLNSSFDIVNLVNDQMYRLKIIYNGEPITFKVLSIQSDEEEFYEDLKKAVDGLDETALMNDPRGCWTQLFDVLPSLGYLSNIGNKTFVLDMDNNRKLTKEIAKARDEE